MPPRKLSRVKILQTNIDRTNALVDSGEFHRFGDVVIFAIRLYRDGIVSGTIGGVEVIDRRAPGEICSVYLEPITDEIVGMTALRRSDVPDYALAWYFEEYRKGKGLVRGARSVLQLLKEVGVVLHDLAGALIPALQERIPHVTPLLLLPAKNRPPLHDSEYARTYFTPMAP